MSDTRNPDKGYLTLPNGCCLYWERNEVGGRRYLSDEIGGGVVVWDTCLVNDSTLIAAIAQENLLTSMEKMKLKKP